jgi:hypothetical protein
MPGWASCPSLSHAHLLPHNLRIHTSTGCLLLHTPWPHSGCSRVHASKISGTPELAFFDAILIPAHHPAVRLQGSRHRDRNRNRDGLGVRYRGEDDEGSQGREHRDAKSPKQSHEGEVRICQQRHRKGRSSGNQKQLSNLSEISYRRSSPRDPTAPGAPLTSRSLRAVLMQTCNIADTNDTHRGKFIPRYLDFLTYLVDFVPVGDPTIHLLPPAGRAGGGAYRSPTEQHPRKNRTS